MKSNTASDAASTSGAGDADRSTAPGRPVSLADEDALDAFVDDAPVALVEFYTDGCGICASMEPVLGNVARGVETDLSVGLVNPRDDPPLVDPDPPEPES